MMNSMATKQTVAKILEVLSCLPGNKDASILTGWMLALEEVSDQDAIIPLKEVLKTFKFFPAPCDYLALIPGKREPKFEEIAAQEFDKLVSLISQYGSYQTPELTGMIKLFVKRHGGWNEMCLKNYQGLTWLKKEYVAFCLQEPEPVAITRQIESSHQTTKLIEQNKPQSPTEINQKNTPISRVAIRKRWNDMLKTLEDKKVKTPNYLLGEGDNRGWGVSD